ncbi:hypothetical protein [Mesorhizobium sp. WSM3879]|uniref:hypothetical protein n=1 Tax=Mesorhizobium sp. WSM3879 TaxID=2029406 RepID=UPI0015C85088|nr:hypothetical protein [Mesorhizobium sp. WSM3879]
MERVFDELIGLHQRQPRRKMHAPVAAWAFRFAGNLMTGVAIGIGIAVGFAVAG